MTGKAFYKFCFSFFLLQFYFDFYSINDLHGKFDNTQDNIGVDELTTYYKQAKEQNPNTIFLSSGDMWQGAAASNLTKGAMVNDWMNSVTLSQHKMYILASDYFIDLVRAFYVVPVNVTMLEELSTDLPKTPTAFAEMVSQTESCDLSARVRRKPFGNALVSGF